MLNLIIKDILIQKKMIIFAFLYIILFSVAFSSKNPIGLGLYVLAPMMVTYTFISNAVNYDEKNKSEFILNSLPLERSDIVISKYISIFVFVFIGIAYSILIGFIGKMMGLPMYNSSISLVDIVVVLTSVCVFSSVFFPPYFKFGYTKTRVFNIILFMLIFFVPMTGIDYAIKYPNNILVQRITYFMNNTSSMTRNSIAITIGLILFMVSLMISIHVYDNKEF